MAPKTVIALVMTLIAGSALAADRRPQIEVCAAANSMIEIDHSQLVVNRIFGKIGVKVNWQGMSKCPSNAIRIAWSVKTPASQLPGAMAYALPFEGTTIVVFLDRIKAGPPELAEPFLGHVLAHEIGHILQGTAQHSDDGVMKAKFTHNEIAAMQTHNFPFASRDAMLIHLGLAGRSEHLASSRTANLAVQTTTAAASVE